jgi:polysaccharide export outer membrane protein
MASMTGIIESAFPLILCLWHAFLTIRCEMTRMKIVCTCAILCVFLSSCYYNKKLVYLQNKKYSEAKPTAVENPKPVYRVQPYDVLSIQIKSSTETTESSGIFNLSSRQGMYAMPGSFYLEGYSVSPDGKITLPVIGDVKVQGLTLEEVQEVVQQNANKYLIKATVIVKMTSFKITVIGDVRNPGYFYVYNNQCTVLEALGMAGDLNLTASRKNVKLIRQTVSGSEVVLLNLMDPKLLSSPYFYVMPGDVLYAEPLKARNRKTNLEILTVIFTGLTTAVLILNYVNTHSNTVINP